MTTNYGVIRPRNASATTVIVHRMYTTDRMGNRLGIYTFDGVEVIDFTAPFGVFAVAQRMTPNSTCS